MGTTYSPLDGSGMWRNVSRSDRAGDYVYDGIEDIGSLDWKDSGQDGAGWYSQYRFDSTLDHLIDELYKENYGSADFNGNDPNYGLKIPRLLSEYLKALEDLVRSADSASKQPRAALEKPSVGRSLRKGRSSGATSLPLSIGRLSSRSRNNSALISASRLGISILSGRTNSRGSRKITTAMMSIFLTVLPTSSVSGPAGRSDRTCACLPTTARTARNSAAS